MESGTSNSKRFQQAQCSIELNRFFAQQTCEHDISAGGGYNLCIPLGAHAVSAAIQFSPRYTIDDYSLWQGDWELWEGIAIAMSPSPFGLHQAIVSRLCRFLGSAIDSANCDAETLVELDWVVNRDTIVRPDVIVVCGQPPACHLERAPALVAEVLSDSTRSNDLNYKRQLYRRENVELYLLVDPTTEIVEVDRRDAEGGYHTFQASEELSLQLCGGCPLTIPIRKLFHR